jgi:hypothetical protein
MPRLASKMCALRPSRSLAAIALLLASASPLGVASAQTAPPSAAPRSAAPQPGAAQPQPGAQPPGAMQPGAMQPGAPPTAYTPPGGAQAWMFTQAPYYGYGTPYVPPPREPFSRGAMTAGAAMTIGGLSALVAGSIVTTVAHGRVDVYCDGPALCAQVDDPKLAQPGLALMIVGGVAAAVGIPLWFYGGRLVPVRKSDAAPPPGAQAAPVLRVGVGGASLSLRF